MVLHYTLYVITRNVNFTQCSLSSVSWKLLEFEKFKFHSETNNFSRRNPTEHIHHQCTHTLINFSAGISWKQAGRVSLKRFAKAESA